MGVFEKLPTVQSCCFCISLKVGCILIGIINLVAIGGVFGSTTGMLEKCKDSIVVKLFVYVYYVLAVLMIILSILFLFGIFKKKTDTTIWFMWGMLAVLVFELACGIAMLASGSSCSVGYTVGGSALFGCIVLFYFLVVVNSYRKSF